MVEVTVGTNSLFLSLSLKSRKTIIRRTNFLKRPIETTERVKWEASGKGRWDRRVDLEEPGSNQRARLVEQPPLIGLRLFRGRQRRCCRLLLLPLLLVRTRSLLRVGALVQDSLSPGCCVGRFKPAEVYRGIEKTRAEIERLMLQNGMHLLAIIRGKRI